MATDDAGTRSSPPARFATNNRMAIFAMLCAMAAFVTNDMLVKLVSEQGVPTGEIIAVRGLIACFIVGLIVFRRGEFRLLKESFTEKSLILRTFFEVAATVSFLTALFHMPIANATAILQAIPLAVTAAAAVFLKSDVGWRRWTAIGVGFCGVLLIIQPGYQGFSIYAGLVLVTLVTSTARDLITRSVPEKYSSYLVTLLTFIFTTAAGFVMGYFENWVALDLRILLYLLCATCLLSIAFFGIITAMRIGDLPVIAPFRYTSAVFAIFFGIVVWQEIPNTMMLCGIMLVIATGIYSFYREYYKTRSR